MILCCPTIHYENRWKKIFQVQPLKKILKMVYNVISHKYIATDYNRNAA